MCLIALPKEQLVPQKEQQLIQDSPNLRQLRVWVEAFSGHKQTCLNQINNPTVAVLRWLPQLSIHLHNIQKVHLIFTGTT